MSNAEERGCVALFGSFEKLTPSHACLVDVDGDGKRLLYVRAEVRPYESMVDALGAKPLKGEWLINTQPLPPKPCALLRLVPKVQRR